MHKIFTVLFLLCAVSLYGQELPNAPSATPQPKAAVVNSHTSYFAGRRWTDPPLRSNHEILHSKSFRLLQIGIWSSAGTDIARNWDGQHLHNQPHGGELLVDALLPTAVNSFMIWGAYKYIWAPIGLGTGAYAIFVHTRSTINGKYN